MRLDRDAQGPGPLVQALVGTGFRIDGALYPQGALLTPVEATDWVAPALADLTLEVLAPVLDPAPEFLLLGTGATLRRPAAALLAALEARGIGVELMGSRAAARAWGVLRAEDRQVAAALLPLDAA